LGPGRRSSFELIKHACKVGCKSKFCIRFENMFLTSLELEARKKAKTPQNYEFELSLKV
jgi:hypothetical protein